MITESSEANVVVEETYPMILIGRDHRVSYANLRAHQLFGYEHGGLHGLSIEQLLAPSRRSEVRNVQAVLIGQAPRRWKSAMRDASGASIEVHVGVEPCHDHRGQVIAVKVRCERLIRSKPSASSDFDSASGLRKIATPPVEAAGTGRPSKPAASASAGRPSKPAASASTGRPSKPAASASTGRPSKPATSASTVRPPTPAASANSVRPAASARPPVNSVRPPPLPSARPTASAPAPAAALKLAPPTAPGKPPPALKSSRPAPAIESWRPGPLIEAPRPPASPSRASVAVKSERPRPPVHSMTLPPAVKTLKPIAAAPEAPSPVTPSGVKVRAIAQALETVNTAPASAPALVLSDDCVEQLETALQLMGWLRERVSKGETLDDPRERARLKYVLTEATELVAEVRCNAKREAEPARAPAERIRARG